MRTRIDSSQRTHIACCACGWRSQVYTADGGKLDARVALVQHEREQHPSASDARVSLHRARRRASNQV